MLLECSNPAVLALLTIIRKAEAMGTTYSQWADRLYFIAQSLIFPVSEENEQPMQ